ITQRGRAAAIMISPESFERSENERQILRRLARGEREISKGKGFDLDAVFAEAEADELCTAVLKVRLTPSARRDVLDAVAFSSETTPMRHEPSVAAPRRSSAAWSVSRDPVGPSLSSRICRTVKSSSHRIPSSTESLGGSS